MTKHAIKKVGWEVLLHSPYSPDFSPFRIPPLFGCFFNNLRGVSFNNDVELKTWLDEFIEPKPSDFYCQGIQQLVNIECWHIERWQEVINNEEEYIVEYIVHQNY